jgi:phosphate transport system substrate-binding protein
VALAALGLPLGGCLPRDKDGAGLSSEPSAPTAPAVGLPAASFSDEVRTVPFVWQTERDITPVADADADAAKDGLEHVFYDGESDPTLYLRQEGENLSFYEVKGGTGASFLFSFKGRRGEGAFRDKDGVRCFSYYGYEDGRGSYCVARYSQGKLRVTRLSDLFDGREVYFYSFTKDGAPAWYCEVYSDNSAGGYLKNTRWVFDEESMSFTKVDVPDKLGGWGGINVSFERGADWRRIVENSDFHIGESDGEYRKFGTYPVIDGSTVCVPLAAEFAWQHLGISDDEARSFVSFNTTHNAYDYLTTKSVEWPIYRGSWRESEGGSVTMQTMEQGRPVDIILATYPSDEELALAKQRGEALAIEPVCTDAFVFIVNKANPVNSLTLEQIRGIYGGKITNWKDVGGEDRPITAYQREPNSGSQSGMERLVMKGEPMAEAPAALYMDSMAGLVEAVAAEYDNGVGSVGYSYKYYVEALYKNENIKILDIDGRAPSDAGRYPLTVNYYGAVRVSDGKDSVGRRFLDWILSDEGQECVKQAGYAPLG